MNKPVMYTFEAFGKAHILYVTPNDLGVVYEKGDAMSQANQQFLWKLDEFIADSNGTWHEAGANYFKWVPGNFFD